MSLYLKKVRDWLTDWLALIKTCHYPSSSLLPTRNDTIGAMAELEESESERGEMARCVKRIREEEAAFTLELGAAPTKCTKEACDEDDHDHDHVPDPSVMLGGDHLAALMGGVTVCSMSELTRTVLLRHAICDGAVRACDRLDDLDLAVERGDLLPDPSVTLSGPLVDLMGGVTVCIMSELTRAALLRHALCDGAVRTCERLDLIVEMGDGDSLRFAVARGASRTHPASASVRAVKKRICQLTGTPANHMKLYYSQGADTPCDLGEGVDVQFSELFLLVDEAVSYTWSNITPYEGDRKQCKVLVPEECQILVVTPAIKPPPSPLSLANESSSFKISMLLKLDLPEGRVRVEGEQYTARIGLQRVYDSAASPWVMNHHWMLGVQLFPGEPGVMVTMELVLGVLHVRVPTRSDDEECVYDSVGWLRSHPLHGGGYRNFVASVPGVPMEWVVRAEHVGTTISIVDGDGDE